MSVREVQSAAVMNRIGVADVTMSQIRENNTINRLNVIGGCTEVTFFSASIGSPPVSITLSSTCFSMTLECVSKSCVSKEAEFGAFYPLFPDLWGVHMFLLGGISLGGISNPRLWIPTPQKLPSVVKGVSPSGKVMPF